MHHGHHAPFNLLFALAEGTVGLWWLYHDNHPLSATLTELADGLGQ